MDPSQWWRRMKAKLKLKLKSLNKKKKKRPKLNIKIQKNQVKIKKIIQRDLRGPPIEMSFINLFKNFEFDLKIKSKIIVFYCHYVIQHNHISLFELYHVYFSIKIYIRPFMLSIYYDKLLFNCSELSIFISLSVSSSTYQYKKLSRCYLYHNSDNNSFFHRQHLVTRFLCLVIMCLCTQEGIHLQYPLFTGKYMSRTRRFLLWGHISSDFVVIASLRTKPCSVAFFK